jgi:hypothetical protein
MGQCATVARPSTVQADNNLVLEWLDDDSEAVHITLVQSKKRKDKRPSWKIWLGSQISGVRELPPQFIGTREVKKIMYLQIFCKEVN